MAGSAASLLVLTRAFALAWKQVLLTAGRFQRARVHALDVRANDDTVDALRLDASEVGLQSVEPTFPRSGPEDLAVKTTRQSGVDVLGLRDGRPGGLVVGV
jgi:hypothetical protein